MKNSLQRKTGFTLVEILLATSIFVILITLGISSYGQIINWKKRDTSTTDLQAAGRHAMEVMAQEIEKADLNDVHSPRGHIYYGFYVLKNGRDDFSDGPITDGNELHTIVNSAQKTIFSYDGNKITKGTISLTPSNVEVTSLKFSGYQKTGKSVDNPNYQQPYVTISMTLQSTQPDPVTGIKQAATFKTTAKPQNFDSLGLAEVQSGSQVSTKGKTSNNLASFASGKSFSKVPVVVTARASMNEDDDNTYIQDTTVNNFTYSVSISDQDENTDRATYWLAVNGDYPNLLKSGNINGRVAANNCSSPAGSTCVTYTNPFTPGTNPISFVMRTNRVEAVMNSVKGNTNNRLVIYGEDQHSSVLNWVSFNGIINNLKLPGSSSPVLIVGQQAANNSVLNCKLCGPYTGLPTYYSCAFYSGPTNYVHSPTVARISFDENFTTTTPNVVITVANKLTDDSFSNATRQQLNVPGVRQVSLKNFLFSNLGNTGGSGAGEKECPSPITNLGMLIIPPDISRLFKDTSLPTFATNYSINWIANNKPFKLTWEYK